MASDLLQQGNLKEVIFIDMSVDDWQSLAEGAPKGSEIVTLDPTRDGLVQMAEWAEGREGYGAIHILSHGSAGQVQLGTTSLNSDSLSDYSDTLAQIGQSLTEDGDILLYGCEVAANQTGVEFIGRLALATGADIAASDDLTGAASLEGDWDLEAASGIVESELPFSIEAVNAYQGVLPVFDLETNVSGLGTSMVTQTVDGVTMKAISYDGIITSGTGGIAVSGTRLVITFNNNNDFLMKGYSLTTGSSDSFGVQFYNGKFYKYPDGPGEVITQSYSGYSQGPDNDLIITPWDGSTSLSFTLTDIEAELANAAPVTTLPSTPSVTEDSSDNQITGLSISDGNSDNQTVTLTATNGTIALSANGGATVTDNDGSDGTLAFNGTLDQVNAALGHLSYTPTADFNGTASLQVQTSDGNGGTDDDTLNITVRAQPDVTVVTEPANGFYRDGQNVDFVVAFDESVTVNTTDGTPRLVLDVGGETRYANYVSASPGSGLTFRYQPTGDDNDSDGIVVSNGNAIDLNGGTILSTVNGIAADTALGDLDSLAGVLVDTTAPTITSVTIPDAALKVGDTATVTITAGEAGLTLNTGIVNGVAVTGFTDNKDNTYTAIYTVREGHADRAASDAIPVNFILADAAGNTSAEYTTAITHTADSIDANAPIITSVTIPDAPLKIGDNATVTITAGEAGLALNTGIVNGVAVTGFTDNNDNTYTAVYTVQEGHADRAASDSIPVNFILADAAGNTSAAYTTAITQAADVIDATTPTLNVAESTPTNNDTLVAVSNDVSLSFSETVTFGVAGTVSLYNETTSSAVLTFDVSQASDDVVTLGDGSTATINGSTLTINPKSNLAGETRYRVEISDGALVDTAAGNPIGTVGDNTLEFTTENPDAIYSEAASFNTAAADAGGDGIADVNNNILRDRLAQADADDTIIVTDNSHLAGSTLNGIGGKNTVVLSDSDGGEYDTADFSKTTDVLNVDTLQVTGPAVGSINLTATQGYDDFTTISGNGATGLELSIEAAIDISGWSLSGLRNLKALSAGGDITLAGAHVSMFGSMAGEASYETAGISVMDGSPALKVSGAKADASNVFINGVSSVNMTETGDTTWIANTDSSQLHGKTFATADTEGVDTFQASAAELLMYQTTLINWDTVSNAQVGTATTMLSGDQLAALTTVKHADADGTDTLTVQGEAVDATGKTFTNIDMLVASATGTVLTVDDDVLAQLDTVTATGGGTETLSTTAQALDVSGTMVTGFEVIETTFAGDATLTIGADTSATTFTAVDGNTNTLSTTHTALDLTKLTLNDINRVTTTNTAGTSFEGADEVRETFVGGVGADIFSSGVGADTLTGGAGTDIFIDVNGDTITDFAADDIIRVTGITTNLNSSEHLSFADGVLKIDGNNDGDFEDTGYGGSDLSVTLNGISGGTFSVTNEALYSDITWVAPPSPSPTPDQNPIKITNSSPQPNTPSGNPSVSETITNTGRGTGTAKLVENSGNANEVTATLPGGVSLVNQGARTAVDSQLALADLINSIDAQQPTNLNAQTGVAGQWLANRPEGTLLDIRTLIISDNSGNSTSTPIQITGVGDDNGASNSHQEAFVIDVRSLPQGNQLLLDNIDFASIVGATTIRGGAGNNVVIGDDAAQTIVLGEGDDELHGGGGNDVIGSEGGDDRLFGGSGDDELFGGEGADLLHGGSDSDVASYEGNRDDYTISQHFGVITVQFKADASDIDTLINIETLTFADDELALSYDDDLQWITGLYVQVLGRQADVEGAQYWAQQSANGMSRAEMALSILNSEESGRVVQEGDEFLDLLYAGLLGRDADEIGKAFWSEQIAAGATLSEVVNGFMFSDEIRSHDLDAVQWDFLV